MSDSPTYSTKPGAASAIFFNDNGELLIVKPTYRPYWNMPGGGFETGESPEAACEREIKEELNLGKKPKRLIAVDYVPVASDGRWGDALLFVFDCGILKPEEIKNIKLPEKELSEFKFLPAEEALKELSDRAERRISSALAALKTETFVYLEDGRKVL